MRILLVTEEITASPSEGLLVFIMHICRYLSARHQLKVIYRDGDPEVRLDALPLLSGRLHSGKDIRNYLKNNLFDVIIYIPSSGMTGFGLLRAMLLGRHSKTPVMVIAMQHRHIGWLHRVLSLMPAPDKILTPVTGMRVALEALRINTGFIMPGFDGDLFKPVDSHQKVALRKKLNLPEDRFIILHVGHIKESRNLQLFLRYREWGDDILPLVKGGEVENSWRERLRQAGMIVMDQYTDDIHELYQASDLYLFPVSSSTGALDFPLSVIEASACGLPVLTTRFGALPDILDSDTDYMYFQQASEISSAISRMRNSSARPTSEKVRSFTWEKVFSLYLDPALGEFTPRKAE
ncbi:MAG: glycosyltransferase family 4 protein [Bacteroidales bacterium]|nr:glycosyltransferase family 4 protein [Candidatus Latescibacterota bacterium]